MVEVLRQSPVAMLVRRRRKQARRGPSRLSVVHASLRGIVCPQSLRCLRVAEFYSDCRYAPPPDGGIRSEPTRHPLGAIVFTGHPDTGTRTGCDRSASRGRTRRVTPGVRHPRQPDGDRPHQRVPWSAADASLHNHPGGRVGPPEKSGEKRRGMSREKGGVHAASCRPAPSTSPVNRPLTSDHPKTTLAGQSGHPCGTRAARERTVEDSRKIAEGRAQGLPRTRRNHSDGGSAGVQTKALLSPFGVPGGPATAVQTPTVRKHAPHRARLGRTSCQLVDCRILTDALCRITHL